MDISTLKKKMILFAFLLSVTWNLSLSQRTYSGEPILETHLPIIAIQTLGLQIEDEPKKNVKMAILTDDLSGKNKFYSYFDDYPYNIGLEIRGQSSQMFFPKKSYAFETRDSLGDNLNISLLGLPKENDWILYGPYSDKTFLRNLLIYELGLQIMDWAPRMVFCELILNNEYQGLYFLSEKIKRDKNRVDIDKCTAKDTVGDDLTGGYILRIDKGDRLQNEGWPSHHDPNGVFFQYYYPKKNKIRQDQKDYIQNYIHNFEECLEGSDFNSATSGYSQYIDVRSFIDYFLLTELCKNIDAYRFSTYLYKDADSNDGKIKMGPLWDYNLAFGNANFFGGKEHTGWAYQVTQTWPNDYYAIPFWWKRLLEDQYFQDRLKTRWLELRTGPLSNTSIQSIISKKKLSLGAAVSRNFNKWPILGRYVWPNTYIGKTYQDEVYNLSRWISNRLIWLDYNLPGKNIPTGKENISTHTSFEVFPNPFINQITVNTIDQNIENIRFELYNGLGQLLHYSNMNSFPTVIDLSQIPPGFYFYKIRKKQQVLHQAKLIKSS